MRVGVEGAGNEDGNQDRQRSRKAVADGANFFKLIIHDTKGFPSWAGGNQNKSGEALARPQVTHHRKSS
jgi:hypothetical protein